MDLKKVATLFQKKLQRDTRTQGVWFRNGVGGRAKLFVQQLPSGSWVVTLMTLWYNHKTRQWEGNVIESLPSLPMALARVRAFGYTRKAGYLKVA